MTYATLRAQIASRIQGIEGPSLAEKLGYRGPLVLPWTPAHVAAQIFSARGSSYGTDITHPTDPTLFQLAAYTLLDPIPKPIGTYGDIVVANYNTHNPDFVFLKNRAGAVSATPYEFNHLATYLAYGLPQGADSGVLWNDFAINLENNKTQRVYEIGNKLLSDLTILDEVPSSSFYQVMSRGEYDVVTLLDECFGTIVNVAGTDAAVYFREGSRLWCYTSSDCTLGLVKTPEGVPLVVGPSVCMLYAVRGLLDDDRFADGALSFIMDTRNLGSGFPTFVRLEGFRQIVEKKYIEDSVFTAAPFPSSSPYRSSSRTRLMYNDYHLTVSAGRTYTMHAVDVTNLEVVTDGHIGGVYNESPGPIDLKPAADLEAFRQSCMVEGAAWMRNGWAAKYKGQGTAAYKYA